MVAHATQEFSSRAGIVRLLGGWAPYLQLSVTHAGNRLLLTATGTTDTHWRLEYRDTVTGTNTWQPLTNITIGSDSLIFDQPLTSPSRYCRGVWLP